MAFNKIHRGRNKSSKKKANNINELFTMIETRIANGIDNATNVALSVLDDYMEMWYSDYDPKEYHRTYYFRDSTDRYDVQISGDCIESAVFINKRAIHHYDVDEILENADAGIHGTEYSREGRDGIQFWSDAIKELQANNWSILVRAFKEGLELDL